jgi:hypothetical protein
VARLMAPLAETERQALTALLHRLVRPANKAEVSIGEQANPIPVLP